MYRPGEGSDPTSTAEAGPVMAMMRELPKTTS